MAIQAADLRLNNWILDHKGTPRQVAYVGETVGLWLSREDGTTQKYQDKPIYSCNIETLSPIPLDADILLAAGFEWENSQKRHLEKEFYDGRMCFYFIGGILEGVQFYAIDGIEMFCIPIDRAKYVHLAQNLAAAVFGEELTINL